MMKSTPPKVQKEVSENEQEKVDEIKVVFREICKTWKQINTDTKCHEVHEMVLSPNRAWA